ncbi:MAG: hypothetical protein J6V98_05970 [Bacteroidales bacterium]|nr:hypothetical protein [Bacteroidales bacterium]
MRITPNKLSWLLLAAVLTCNHATQAQFIYTTHDARSGAMGGSLIYDLGERCVGLDYRQGFLLAGMGDKSLRLVWPTGRTGAVVAHYQHHGNADYHEQQATAGYAIRAAEWLQVGVAARYLHLGTSDGHYPARQWLAASALLQAAIGDKTTLMLTAGSRPWDSVRPYRLHAQVQYRPLPQLLTVLEAESEECARLRMGMEYCYREQFYLRSGLATRPLLLTFGLGFRQHHYAIDLAVEVHNTLGLTPHTSLTLWF